MKKLLLTVCSLTLMALESFAGGQLLPETIQLSGPQSSQRIIAVVTGKEGTVVQDVTATTSFTSSNPKVATVDTKGVVRPVSDGETTITAVVDGKPSSTKVKVIASKDAFVPSFRNHVEPVLMRSGCNSGACHGALAGKGGFKLSLRGYDPESDHFVLTRQALARRVNQQHPAESLLLQKATRTIPHGGGTRFADDSSEYEVLLRWIQSGAEGPKENDPKLEKIEVLPPRAQLQPKGRLQVIVRAFYSNGKVEDVTRLARYSSSEELVMTVDDSGAVSVVGHGEGAINVNFGTQVSSITITSPYPSKVPETVYKEALKHNYIDDLILDKLRSLHLPPSQLCSDEEFLRRVYLDSCGILPTSEERIRFLDDKDPKKRARLIDSIVERSEFVDYWAYKWSDMLLVSTRRVQQPAMWSFYRWVRQSVSDNKPWDQFARELVTASGSTLHNGATNFFVLHKDIAELTEATSVTFLGMSITCCRCHNHPLEKWTQDQYWSLASLFSRVGLKNGDRTGEVIVQSLRSGDVLHPRRNIAMPPTPLDGKALPDDSIIDRRAYFADWLTSPENPYFARAIVNRVWRNYMGRGLVEAEDDLRETNPPSNKELFDALAKDFIKKKYDVKYLTKLILNSASYQRSSRPVPENASDDRFYSRYLVKRLSAEVLLDVYSQVTGVPTPFTHVYTGVEGGVSETKNYPLGTRAMQLPDSRVASTFLDSFGRPDRTQTCSCERQQDSTVTQALHLNNGKTLNDKLRTKGSRPELWASEKISDAEAVKRVYQLALCREPTTAELKKFQNIFKEVDKSDPKAHKEALEDLFWAVLTGREFMFNR